MPQKRKIRKIRLNFPDVYLVSKIPRNKMRAVVFAMLFAAVGFGALVFTHANPAYQVRFVVVCASNYSCSQSQSTINNYAVTVQNWYKGQIGSGFTLDTPTSPINSGQTVAWFTNNPCGGATDNQGRALCNVSNILGVNTSPYEKTIVVAGFPVFPQGLCGLTYTDGYTGLVDPSACSTQLAMVMAHEAGHEFNLDSAHPNTYSCQGYTTEYHTCDGSLMDPWGCGSGSLSNCILDTADRNIVLAQDSNWFNLPPAINSTPNFEAAFEANSNSLWTAGSGGITNWAFGMYPGTSPSVAIIPGGYEVAFQSNTGQLWTVGNAGDKDWGLAMAPGTSPSIAAVPGGYEVAYQSSNGTLAEAGTAGTTNLGNAMYPKSSPSICAVAGGGIAIAFQDNNSSLATTGAYGYKLWSLGMYAGSSPSIAYVAGGFEVAFEANTSSLWTVGNAGYTNWGLGMYPGTNPSMTSLGTGGYEVAFEDNTSSLWTVGNAGNKAWGLGMFPGTSPSITSVSGGFEVAFQANTTTLWTIGNAGSKAWGLGMNSSSSPAL